MPGTPARVVLLTDRRSHRAKAAAVQSVIEVTGVDPPTAVKLLSDNAWNTSEAIAECVNLREFRERLSQAEAANGRRFCILSVHLLKLAHLKHTGMHSIRLDLDGDIQQTGWISGDHAKIVGVSFEFRHFRPESRLKMEVWHKRTIRENKMVGWCFWRIASLSEDPILRFNGWTTLTHKQTTGGSLQAEIWLRFFDLPRPPPPSSISTDAPSSESRRKVAGETSYLKRKVTGQTEAVGASEKSVDLLDDFLGSFEASGSGPTTGPTAGAWDLGGIDPGLFSQRVDESRAASQERSSREGSLDNTYRTPEEGYSSATDQESEQRRKNNGEGSIRETRDQPYLVSNPQIFSNESLYPSLRDPIIEWFEGPSDNPCCPDEQLPPDPWTQDTGEAPGERQNRHLNNFVRKPIDTISTKPENVIQDLTTQRRDSRAPIFPTEDPPEENSQRPTKFECGNPWMAKLP